MAETTICPRATTLVFDLDGTLIDPFEGITRCQQFALERMGIEPPPQRQLARFIGPPLRHTFAELLGEGRGRDDIERAVSAYRERFAAIGVFEAVVYDGIAEVLGKLRERGVTLFVATSKPRPFAERILDHFALREFFHGVYGPELDGRLDDKRELVAHLRAEQRLAASDAALVGDREHDVFAAKCNGLCAIGATWGYGSEDELVAAKADALCHEPQELFRLVAR